MRIVGVVALPYNISAKRCTKVFNLFRRENIAEANMEQKLLPGNLCGNASKRGHFATYGLSKSLRSGKGVLGEYPFVHQKLARIGPLGQIRVRERKRRSLSFGSIT